MSTVRSPIDAEPVGPLGAQVDITQRPALAVTGWLGVLVLAGTLWWIVVGHQHNSGWLWVPAVVFVLVITSLVIVTPGQTSVVQFFGSYIGTVQRPGFWWVLPLTLRRGVSVRVRNFETGHLKVNDADGSPVEIAAIVVWQIADTAKSTYAVQNYLDFVTVQAESALRHVATRVCIAGVEIVEVRISHLAYAPEIAQAMLRRQQASAVVAAGSRIVEGAVGMVEMALNRLTENGVVALDEERKAAMVSNLMVVLCGDQPPSPVVNAGSLYT